MHTIYETKTSRQREALKDFFGGFEGEQVPEELLDRLFQYEELMIKYRSAIREITTKLEILNDELSSSTKQNPIESIQSRIKHPQSIAGKLRRLNQPVAVESIARNLNDVAGIRVICPFINDIYAVEKMLLQQDDVRLISRKDYIRSPKESGYRSLHLVVEIPVFFSMRKEFIRVEIQIRTVAMNFWASLEECADTIARTDERMQALRQRILTHAEEVL